MQSHYEINVAERAHDNPKLYRHLFATHDRSIITEEQAVHVLAVFTEKFPHPQFEITLIHRELVNKGVDIDMLVHRIKRSNQEKRMPGQIMRKDAAIKRIQAATNSCRGECIKAYAAAHQDEDKAIEIIRRKGTTGSNDFYLKLKGEPPIDTQE